MPNVSYLAIIVAAFASFVFGAVWYVLLGVRWQAALGKSEAELQAAASPVPFVATGVGLVIMAWMLAGILGHLGMVDVWHGMGNRFAEFSPNSQIRLASNYLKLSDFEQGWSDEHVLSQPLSGALFDLFVDVFHQALVDIGVSRRDVADLADITESAPEYEAELQAEFVGIRMFMPRIPRLSCSRWKKHATSYPKCSSMLGAGSHPVTSAISTSLTRCWRQMAL